MAQLSRAQRAQALASLGADLTMQETVASLQSKLDKELATLVGVLKQEHAAKLQVRGQGPMLVMI